MIVVQLSEPQEQGEGCNLVVSLKLVKVGPCFLLVRLFTPMITTFFSMALIRLAGGSTR